GQRREVGRRGRRGGGLGTGGGPVVGGQVVRAGVAEDGERGGRAGAGEADVVEQRGAALGQRLVGGGDLGDADGQRRHAARAAAVGQAVILRRRVGHLDRGGERALGGRVGDFTQAHRVIALAGVALVERPGLEDVIAGYGERGAAGLVLVLLGGCLAGRDELL